METKTYSAKITILDPEQQIITEQEYSLDIQNGTIDKIEQSVSVFRNTVLSNLEQSILENEQKEYIKKNP
ncbi:MAG: hypothetical protein HQK65_17655 [Desulfamplus sp.]|nr:hypothetical protein [Desulfamplus sp.]